MISSSIFHNNWCDVTKMNWVVSWWHCSACHMVMRWADFLNGSQGAHCTAQHTNVFVLSAKKIVRICHIISKGMLFIIVQICVAPGWTTSTISPLRSTDRSNIILSKNIQGYAWLHSMNGRTQMNGTETAPEPSDWILSTFMVLYMHLFLFIIIATQDTLCWFDVWTLSAPVEISSTESVGHPE